MPRLLSLPDQLIGPWGDSQRLLADDASGFEAVASALWTFVNEFEHVFVFYLHKWYTMCTIYVIYRNKCLHMNNKLIYLLMMLASVSAVYGEIQVVKTAFNQDKNTNTAFNALTDVAATAGQKLIVTINQEGPHKLNILSVQYGKSDFTLAVQDDASSFKLAEIWYLDVTHDIVSDIVIKYCDSSAKDPVPCNARSAVGGPIKTHTVSRTHSLTPGAVSYEFAAGKDACFVVGAYV